MRRQLLQICVLVAILVAAAAVATLYVRERPVVAGIPEHSDHNTAALCNSGPSHRTSAIERLRTLKHHPSMARDFSREDARSSPDTESASLG